MEVNRKKSLTEKLGTEKCLWVKSGEENGGEENEIRFFSQILFSYLSVINLPVSISMGVTELPSLTLRVSMAHPACFPLSTIAAGFSICVFLSPASCKVRTR